MPQPPFDLKRFGERLGSWLSAVGPESDVVVSCRVRLARNVADAPFVARLAPEQATDLAERLKDVLAGHVLARDAVWIGMEDASPVLRLCLRERHIISRDLAPAEDGQGALPGRAVAFEPSESTSVMVNEEDHLRIQALAPGFQLDAVLQRAQAIDRALEAHLAFAHSAKLGYLTCCPTNVGTGLRASVMLHLPALSLVKSELAKVFAAAQRTGLAVRGMYGEGSRAAGDMYQISNQVTLGRSEEELVLDLQALVPAIVQFERKLRKLLLDERRAALEQRVKTSAQVLRTARSMPTEAALAHLSHLRLGVELGLVGEVRYPLLNRLGVLVQKGHVQAVQSDAPPNVLIETSERDRLRAGLLRRQLAARDAN